MTGPLPRLALAALIGAALLGCAAKKPDHFGTGVNFPTFTGPADLARSFHRTTGIMYRHQLDGQPVDMSWIDPKFREKICLVVTINNHCGGG